MLFGNRHILYIVYKHELLYHVLGKDAQWTKKNVVTKDFDRGVLNIEMFRGHLIKYWIHLSDLLKNPMNDTDYIVDHIIPLLKETIVSSFICIDVRCA